MLKPNTGSFVMLCVTSETAERTAGTAGTAARGLFFVMLYFDVSSFVMLQICCDASFRTLFRSITNEPSSNCFCDVCELTSITKPSHEL